MFAENPVHKKWLISGSDLSDQPLKSSSLKNSKSTWELYYLRIKPDFWL